MKLYCENGRAVLFWVDPHIRFLQPVGLGKLDFGRQRFPVKFFPIRREAFAAGMGRKLGTSRKKLKSEAQRKPEEAKKKCKNLIL